MGELSNHHPMGAKHGCEVFPDWSTSRIGKLFRLCTGFRCFLPVFEHIYEKYFLGVSHLFKCLPTPGSSNKFNRKKALTK